MFYAIIDEHNPILNLYLFKDIDGAGSKIFAVQKMNNNDAFLLVLTYMILYAIKG